MNHAHLIFKVVTLFWFHFDPQVIQYAPLNWKPLVTSIMKESILLQSNQRVLGLIVLHQTSIVHYKLPSNCSIEHLYAVYRYMTSLVSAQFCCQMSDIVDKGQPLVSKTVTA